MQKRVKSCRKQVKNRGETLITIGGSFLLLGFCQKSTEHCEPRNLTHELSHESAHKNAHGSVHEDVHGNAKVEAFCLKRATGSPPRLRRQCSWEIWQCDAVANESVLGQFSHVLLSHVLFLAHCGPFSSGFAWASPNASRQSTGKMTNRPHFAHAQSPSPQTQRALRDILMSRGKNCLPVVSRQFLTRNYPCPNRLLKCLPNCLSPTGEGIFSSFKITPAVRVFARQLRDKNCPGAIFAPGHQDVSQGPLGSLEKQDESEEFPEILEKLKIFQAFFMRAGILYFGHFLGAPREPWQVKP